MRIHNTVQLQTEYNTQMDSLAEREHQVLKPTGVNPYIGDDNIPQEDISEKKTWQDYLYDQRN